MTTNIFGPGHYPTTGEVAERPTPIATAKGFDAWFAQCNPDGTGGTAIDEMWLNHIIATLRSSVRTAGAQETELLDNMLSEAMARYASGGVFYSDAGTPNSCILASPALFVTPKAYFQGMEIRFFPANANNGATTVNVAGIGAKKLLSSSGVDLRSGQLSPGILCEALYDPSANSGAGAFVLKPWSVLSASLTIYVRGDGNDANSGFYNTAGGALRSIQAAINKALSFPPSRFAITIQCGAAQYASFNITNVPYALLNIIGDPTTPSNCEIVDASGIACALCKGSQITTLNGFRLTGSGYGLAATGLANVSIANIELNLASTAGHSPVFSGAGSIITQAGALKVLGNSISGGVFVATKNASIILDGQATTLSGNPTYQYFAYAPGGFISAAAATFSGAGTGKRYFAEIAGAIYVAAAGANLFPGTIAGTLGDASSFYG